MGRRTYDQGGGWVGGSQAIVHTNSAAPRCIHYQGLILDAGSCITDSKCVAQWKSYCKRFHFDPLKCIAGLMYNVKRIGVWKYEVKISRDWPPPPPGDGGI
jgi:hypothetical protein